VIEINDLDGAREVLVGEVPEPNGAIAEDGSVVGPTPAAPSGFRVETSAELFGGFDGAGVGGGGLVAHGLALLVSGGRREHAAQFDFAPTGWLAFQLAGAALADRLAGKQSFPVTAVWFG
jgi:hypothetical protein